MAAPGSYALLIHVQAEAELPVGRLGRMCFPAGYYLYCGSAQGGLEGRLRRHLRREKRVHWHVDYLLAVGRVAGAWVLPGREHVECAWARLAVDLPGARLAVAGFGSSDCRCRGHLVYWGAWGTRVSRARVQRLTGSRVWVPYSCAASYIATMFSTGVLACRLWQGADDVAGAVGGQRLDQRA